jgi:adenine/guanine phosphoribosyltransferase-like PRPP-binding protein
VNATWSGGWVADRLDAQLVTDSSSNRFLTLPDLVGLALRQNSRRAHLLVSSVLGKHIPADPRIVYGAGRLLGVCVADVLRSSESGVRDAGSALLAAALDGHDESSALVDLCEQHARAATSPAIVLGFAETATGLGHAVADSLSAPYLHSTRRVVGGLTPMAGFEEEHSHATSHFLLPEDPSLLAGSAPLVLVDDELSTGRTAMNTIRALHASSRGQRSRYVVAALIGVRSAGDRAEMDAFAVELGITVDVVCLVTGELALARDVLDLARSLLVEHGVVALARPPQRGVVTEAPPGLWPDGVREGGRHGFEPPDRRAFDDAVSACAAHVASALERGPAPLRVLVLGCEELMYAPLRIALALQEIVASWATVCYSTTTRSPVLPVDDVSYAVRTRLTFPSHDNTAGDTAPRYAHNVAAGDDVESRFTDIVAIIDSEANTLAARQPGGLFDQLASACDRLKILVLPTYRPSCGGAS